MSERPEVDAGVADVDLDGRTALVTGSTSGVGRETALALARLGAEVVVHGRDRDAGERVASACDRGGGGTFRRADFRDHAAVDDLAAAVRERTDALDLLVHNAGGHFETGRLVDAGAGRAERTFVVNHLAPFRLTRRLRDHLAADARVVVVASTVHGRADGTFDVRDLAGYDGLDAYARSKLANVAFARGLADRLDGPTANACHPGFVPASGLWRNASGAVSLAVGALALLPARFVPLADSPASAAATPTYLAAAPDCAGENGGYFVDRARTEPAPVARDPDVRARLWDLSEDLTGLAW